MTDKHDSYDVLIAGGGVIGLACAWRAAQRGLRVAVLEREAFGAGASGVAAGMLAPVGEASWGEERLLGFNLASLRLWEGFAAELADEAGIDFGYGRLGALHVALDRDEAEALQRRSELHHRLGLESRRLRPSECRRLEPALSTAVAGGVEAPGEAAVDPARLCEALAVAVEGGGGTLKAGAEIVELELNRDAVAVRTALGEVYRAPRLVLCTGAWSAAEWVPPEHRPPVRPVRGEILTLRGSAEAPVCERIIAGERVYLVPRGDGRLVVGASVEERGFETAVSAGAVHELLREAYRLLPEISELEFAGARSGLRPGTPDNLPLVGASGETGLILACGHYRNGVLQAPATAEVVGALLAGDTSPVDAAALSPERFRGDRAARRRSRREAVAR